MSKYKTQIKILHGYLSKAKSDQEDESGIWVHHKIEEWCAKDYIPVTVVPDSLNRIKILERALEILSYNNSININDAKKQAEIELGKERAE